MVNLTRRDILTVVATAAVFQFGGCVAFENRYPRFAGKDFRNAKWMSRNALKGEKWEHEVVGIIFDADSADVAFAEEPIKRATTTMQLAASALMELERAGATFEVKVAKSRRVSIAFVSAPNPAPRVPPLKAIEEQLSMLPFEEDSVEDSKLGNVVDRYYGACRDLEHLHSTSKVTFTLPDGVTQERYEELLYALVARLHASHRELDGFLVSMTALRVALRSMDREHGGSSANAIAVLDAYVREVRDAKAYRSQFASWPLRDKARETAIVERGKQIFTETITTPAYIAWRDESGDARNGRRFGKVLLGVVRQFSAGLSAGMGVDAAAEVTDMLDTFDLLKVVDLLIQIAPVDSKVKSMLREGKRLTLEIAQGGLQEVVQREGNAAMQRATDAATKAVRAKLVLMLPEDARRVMSGFGRLGVAP